MLTLVDKHSFGDYFLYVDFGEKANRFLRSCGVKDYPSPSEMAELLVKSSSEFLSSGDDIEKYFGILRIISGNFHMIQHNTSLLSQMKKTPFLLGLKKQAGNSQNKMSEEGGKSDEEPNKYKLAVAKDIFINDHTVYQRVFNVLTVPRDDLENFYEVIIKFVSFL